MSFRNLKVSSTPCVMQLAKIVGVIIVVSCSMDEHFEERLSSNMFILYDSQ